MDGGCERKVEVVNNREPAERPINDARNEWHTRCARLLIDVLTSHASWYQERMLKLEFRPKHLSCISYVDTKIHETRARREDSWGHHFRPARFFSFIFSFSMAFCSALSLSNELMTFFIFSLYCLSLSF